MLRKVQHRISVVVAKGRWSLVTAVVQVEDLWRIEAKWWRMWRVVKSNGSEATVDAFDW